MNEEQSFNVKYENIVKEKSLLSITRLLAADISKNPYMTVGDFFKDITDGDLSSLSKIIDIGEEHKNFEDIMLISMMLAAAEGCEASKLDEYVNHFNQFAMFVACESLFRKGIVKLYRENMSFGEDLKNAIIVEKLDENY
jgi:hypothetical protein